MQPFTESENQMEWQIASVEREVFMYLTINLLKWIAKLWVINNLSRCYIKRWKRQATKSCLCGVHFSRNLVTALHRRKGDHEMLVGYLVGWSSQNYEIMQKGVAHSWSFELEESVIFTHIQWVKLHVWLWWFSYSKGFLCVCCLKNKQVCWTHQWK